MFCNHCGKRQPDDAVFCSFCGKPIDREDTGRSDGEAKTTEPLHQNVPSAAESDSASSNASPVPVTEESPMPAVHIAQEPDSSPDPVSAENISAERSNLAEDGVSAPAAAVVEADTAAKESVPADNSDGRLSSGTAGPDTGLGSADPHAADPNAAGGSRQRLSLEEKLSRLEQELSRMGAEADEESDVLVPDDLTEMVPEPLNEKPVSAPQPASTRRAAVAGQANPDQPPVMTPKSAPGADSKRPQETRPRPTRSKTAASAVKDEDLPDFELFDDWDEDEPDEAPARPAPRKTSSPPTAKQQAAKKKAKKKSPVKWIVLSVCGAVVVAAGIIALVLFLNMNSPANRIVSALQQGDTQTAATLFSEVDPTGSQFAKVQQALNDYVDQLMDSYKSGQVSASDALEQLQTILKFNVPYLTDKVSKHITELTQQLDVEEIYNKAQQAYEAGNYADAITYYSQIESTSPHYSDAQEKLEQAREKYKQQYLDEAAALAKKDDYVGAIDKLNDALKILKDDKELTDQIATYTDSYVDSVLSQADALAKKEDYERAEKLLAQAIQLFPDEKELYSKQSEIAAKKSIDLIDACAPNAGKGCTVYKSGSSFKMGTQSYSPGFVINNQNVDLQSGEEAYAQVTFDQKYSSLSMLIGRTGNSQQGTFSVHIYLDNKLVRQYEIDDDSVKTVTLDVSGAETLRVVVISQTSGIECGFAEAALKK